MCPALLETISPPRVITAGQIPQLDGHRTLGISRRFSLCWGGGEGGGGRERGGKTVSVKLMIFTTELVFA